MKQLYDRLTISEIRAMTPKDRKLRLELCEHQLRNKENALTFIEAKPYMLAELDGLRANIMALKATRA